MRYSIQTLQVKNIPSLGKKVAEMEVKDIEGNTLKGSMWEDFPSFNTMTFGSQFEADLVYKEKNGYTTGTFYAPKGLTKRSFGGKADMTKIMDTKAQNIEKSQDRKEEAISKAGAQRDAVLIVTTFYKNLADSDLETVENQVKLRIAEWYKYFLNLGYQPFV